jgi:hypothetical protein
MVNSLNVGCINQIVLRSLTRPIKAISEDSNQIFIGERWYLQMVFTLGFRDLWMYLYRLGSCLSMPLELLCSSVYLLGNFVIWQFPAFGNFPA